MTPYTTTRRLPLSRYLALVISVILAGIMLQSHAATSGTTTNSTDSPEEIVKNTSDEVISQLCKEPNIANNIPTAYAIIKKYAAPYMDNVGMARSVLGRQRWKATSASQQRRFTDTFKVTVMRTYAVALSQYTNETVRVLPLRGNQQQSRVIVKTQILGNGPTVAVNYRLVRKNDGWKVYDFDVEGVSMLRSFRSQFAEELARNNSLDALINTLQQHNRDVK